MRMRLKKHLDERIANCQDVLVVKEPYEFYKLTEQQRQMQIDVKNTFGNDNDLVLELGCGKGAFAIQYAQTHPQCNYVALEKLSNVIVVGCENAQSNKVDNLRFFNCRAENLLCYLPKHSVKKIVLNFSCPFPKKTYANRRLTSPNYLNLYKQLLTDDGVICQKTDNLPFFEYSLESYDQNGFETFGTTYDLGETQDGNIVTEYESKFRSQHLPIYATKARVKK